jgi:nucleotide-binding universal stress UspA family protein
MKNKAIHDTASVASPLRFGAGATRRTDPPEPVPTAVEAADGTARASNGHRDTLRAAIDRAEPPAPPPNPFQAIICANERTAADGAARHQATLLASPGGTVKLASMFHLSWHGQPAIDDTCDGYDLLALGASDAAFTALEYAPIPTLIARLCPLGMQVTDRIVVCVGNPFESRRAVELAGLLAAAHRGTVTILAVPPLSPALDRAIAASFRVLLEATGAAPRVCGELLPPERTIPSAAAALTASLVVLGSGQNLSERRTTQRIARAIACSVLAVPDPQPFSSP